MSNDQRLGLGEAEHQIGVDGGRSRLSMAFRASAEYPLMRSRVGRLGLPSHLNERTGGAAGADAMDRNAPLFVIGTNRTSRADLAMSVD
jgi:hypothetical protein